MKRGIRIVLSLGLSALFLWVAFRRVDFAALFEQLASVRPVPVVAYVACLVGIQICRVLRWGVLVRPFAPLTLAQNSRISNLGLMLILVLPLRLGEFARPVLMKRETGASLSSGLGAAAVERVVDGLLITLLFFVTTSGLPATFDVPPTLRVAAWVSLAIFAGACAVILAVLAGRRRAMTLLQGIGARVAPRLAAGALGMLERFLEGLRALPNARAIGGFVAYTLVYWALNGFGLWGVMHGFGMDLPPVAGFVLVCVIVLGIMIPAGPGHLGTYQAAILLGLEIFRVDPTRAAAFGLVVYPLNVLVVVAAGLPYLFGHRERVLQVMEASTTGAAEVSAAAPGSLE